MSGTNGKYMNAFMNGLGFDCCGGGLGNPCGFGFGGGGEKCFFA